MELLKVVRMTVPTLESLIHSENYDFAVNLVHQSDKTYMEKLKLLLCLK